MFFLIFLNVRAILPSFIGIELGFFIFFCSGKNSGLLSLNYLRNQFRRHLLLDKKFFNLKKKKFPKVIFSNVIKFFKLFSFQNGNNVWCKKTEKKVDIMINISSLKRFVCVEEVQKLIPKGIVDQCFPVWCKK